MSFYTSLSGLKGAQSDLSVISNNVANVGTTGFKKSRTDFGDLVSSSALQSGSIAGQGTRLKAIEQQFSQGGFRSTDSALDLAISGQGFFVTAANQNGGGASFTRNGGFGFDPDHYVTDSRGAYLQVLPVDSLGNVTATGLSAARSLQIPPKSGDPKATSTVDLKITLPSDAVLPKDRPVYTADNEYAFDPADPDSYNFSGATTVYDASGNASQATMYYVRTKAPDADDATSGWEGHLVVGGKEVGVDGSVGNADAPLKLSFDANGKLTAPTAAVEYEAAGLTFAYDPESAQGGSTFAVNKLAQDGYAAGDLTNVSIGADGLVSATYSNGTTQAMGKVLIATFANPSGLRQTGDASWNVSGASGEPIVGEAGAGGLGVIQSGALEQSNVDITEELVALITAQRNFQANAKAIDTANQMTQIAVNLRGS